MYSPRTIFNNRFVNLDRKWNLLSQQSSQDELDVAEFNKLYQQTLEIILDVSDGKYSLISRNGEIAQFSFSSKSSFDWLFSHPASKIH